MFAGLWLGADNDQRGLPHKVVNLVFDNDWTPIRAWREYLTLTQAEVAGRIGGKGDRFIFRNYNRCGQIRDV